MRCTSGMVYSQDGSATQSDLEVAAGYWRADSSSAIMYKCPLKGCLGGKNYSANGDGYCAEGYTGPMCSVCAERTHYLNPEALECVECGNARNPFSLIASSVTLLIFTLIIALVVSYIMWKSCSKSRSGNIDGTRKNAQKLKALDDSRKDLKLKFKALSGFFQIASGVGFACSVSLPANFAAFVAPLNIFQLNVIPSLGLNCQFSGFNYVKTMVSKTFVAAVLTLCI